MLRVLILVLCILVAMVWTFYVVNMDVEEKHDDL
jgi:hypothetical protein